jgi:hypothetical protein
VTFPSSLDEHELVREKLCDLLGVAPHYRWYQLTPSGCFVV